MTSAPTATRLLMIGSIGAGAGALMAGAALLVSAGYLISRAAGRPPILDLALVFVAVRFFGLARPALRYAERLASHDATLRVLRQVRRWFCDACLPLAPARLLDWRSGDLLARVASDVDTLQDGFLRVTAPIAVAAIVCGGAAIALLVIDPILAAIFVTIVITAGAVIPAWRQRAAAGAGERAGVYAALTADLVTLVRGLDDVAAFGQEAAQARRVAERQAALDDGDRRDAQVEAFAAAASTAVAGLGAVAMLMVLAWRVQQGALDGVGAVAILLGVLGALEAVDGLPQAWRARERVRPATDRVFEIVRAAPAVVDAAAPEPWPPFSRPPSLQIEEVTFGYESGRPALDAVSLTVAAGEHVAIVGPSGAGKSTLLGLVCRFRDPQRGRLTIEGRDIRHTSLADLRASIAVVPQDVHVLDTSLRENVRLARANATDAEIQNVLRAVGLDRLAATRAGDLDATMGEDGLHLSAGERQRLGLARIMLTDARLALVDEPTAQLDVETERDVLAALRTWACDRTLIVVSHRLSTVRRFDRLIVLDRGRLAAAGTHDALLFESDVYRGLWDAELHMLATR